MVLNNFLFGYVILGKSRSYQMITALRLLFAFCVGSGVSRSACADLEKDVNRPQEENSELYNVLKIA